MQYHIEYTRQQKKKRLVTRVFIFANNFMYNVYASRTNLRFLLNHFYSFICIWKETNCMQIFLLPFFFVCVALVLALNPLLCIKIVNHIFTRGFVFWLSILNIYSFFLFFFICSYYKAVLLFYTYFCRLCYEREGI